MRGSFSERLSKSQLRAALRFSLNPPQSVREFAEEIGIAVVELELDQGHFGYLEERPELGSATGYVIFVNEQLSSLEKRWAVAHELGHYFLHRDRREFTFDSAVHLKADRSEYFLLGDEENEAENFAEDLFFAGGALAAFISLHGADTRLLASKVFGVPERKFVRAIDFYSKYRGLSAPK